MLILFTSKTCTPCQILKQLLQATQTKYTEVDIEFNFEACVQHCVRSVPTLVKVDVDGNELGRITGLPSPKKLQDFTRD